MRPGLRPFAVVSGLPLVAMPRPLVTAMVDDIVRLLPPGGHFRTFTYLHSIVNPSQWWLRGLLSERFAHFRLQGPVVRNLPPALIFSATK